MRLLVSTLAALAACLVLPPAIVGVWLYAVVDDTDRYVATVSPLAEDPAVLAAVQRSLSLRTVELLEQSGGTLGGQLAARYEEQIGQGARVVVESPQFPPAWDAANAVAHEQLLAELREDQAASTDIRLDLGRVLDAVVEEVGGSLPVRVSPPGVEVPVTVLEGAQVERARAAYQTLSASAVVLPVVWLVLVALALVVARRRARLLALLGSGSAATLLLMLLALGRVRDRAVAAVPESDRALSAAVWDGVVADLRTSLWLALGLAAALAAAALIALVLSRPRRPGAGAVGS